MIGGRMRQRGHIVHLLDAAVGDVRFANLRRAVADFAPDIALLTVSAPTFRADLEAIGEIRAAASRCSIGVLGVHPTALPELYITGKPHADFVVRGEPELTCEAAVEMLVSGGKVSPLPGLSVRLRDGVVHGPDRPPVSDVSSLGKPDWYLSNPCRYRLPLLGRPFLSVLTSRGCPYACTFCTQHLYYGRTIRLRPPEEIAAEVSELQASFGIHDFFLWSECFSADREHAHKVCEALRHVQGISWVATTRADCVDLELLRAMREAGCWLIGFGFESGTQETLDGCRKGHTVEDSFRAARWAREAGLFVLGHFIFGLPGETPTTAKATLKLALALDIDFAQFYCAAPYPGTPLYDSWCLSSAEGETSVIAISQERACMATDGLSPREVEWWRRWATYRFYARARPIALLTRLALSGIFGRRDFGHQTQSGLAI